MYSPYYSLRLLPKRKMYFPEDLKAFLKSVEELSGYSFKVAELFWSKRATSWWSGSRFFRFPRVKYHIPLNPIFEGHIGAKMNKVSIKYKVSINLMSVIKRLTVLFPYSLISILYFCHWAYVRNFAKIKNQRKPWKMSRFTRPNVAKAAFKY